LTIRYTKSKLGSVRNGIVISAQISKELGSWCKKQAEAEELSLSAWIRAVLGRERRRQAASRTAIR
jgi:hypothetical protein